MSGKTPSSEEMTKAMFLNMVMMFTTSAMQQLGKLMSSETNKAEVDLEGAQISIDMLAMLREKTTGNLDKDEKRMLDDALASLQMNFVQTASQQPKTDTKPQPAPAGAPAAQAEQTPASEIKKEPTAEPKYHKSYGG